MQQFKIFDLDFAIFFWNKVKALIRSCLPHDYSKDYLTFEALEDGTFTFTIGADISDTYKIDVTSVSYSLDNGKTWVTTQRDASTTTTITTPTIQAGGKVLWKGIGEKYDFSEGFSIHSSFSSTCDFNISGNINSLCYGDDFVGLKVAKRFGWLFYNCNVISAEKLILSPVLCPMCFCCLFRGCGKLVKAPKLPATTLEQSCYGSMFYGCTSLKNAPELPATTLANYCYDSMFNGCSSLIYPPSLPAATLKKGCYASMFYNCAELVYAPLLPSRQLDEQCYKYMFYYCVKITVAPDLPAKAIYSESYAYMFYRCSGLVKVPYLAAGNLSRQCCEGMFHSCTSLIEAPVLLAGTLSSRCYEKMFYGCTKLKHVKALFTTTPSDSYTKDWLSGVSQDGVFVKGNNATWNVTGANGVPSGWKVYKESEYEPVRKGDVVSSITGSGNADKVPNCSAVSSAINDAISNISGGGSGGEGGGGAGLPPIVCRIVSDCLVVENAQGYLDNGYVPAVFRHIDKKRFINDPDDGTSIPGDASKGWAFYLPGRYARFRRLNAQNPYVVIDKVPLETNNEYNVLFVRSMYNDGACPPPFGIDIETDDSLHTSAQYLLHFMRQGNECRVGWGRRSKTLASENDGEFSICPFKMFLFGIGFLKRQPNDIENVFTAGLLVSNIAEFKVCFVKTPGIDISMITQNCHYMK